MEAYAAARSTAGGKLKLKRSGAASGSRPLADGAKKRRTAAPAADGEGAAEEEVPVVKGSGRLVSSGDTVQGFETHFKEEAAAGDELLVHHPNSLRVESRVVVGVLSQRSLKICQPFSSDLISTTTFHIRKDSERLQQLAEQRAAAAAEKAEAAADPDSLPDPDDDDGGAASNRAAAAEAVRGKLVADEASKQLQRKLQEAAKYKTVTWREKTGMWGYRTVTERVRVTGGSGGGDVAEAFSAEQQLDLRAKRMGRDKFCW